MLEKVWFIDIAGKKEGPFSVLDLRRDERITPDTLVWKQGFPAWLPIRDVPELNSIFEDSEEFIPLIQEPLKQKADDEIALDWRDNNPQYIFWLLLALLIIIYALHHTS